MVSAHLLCVELFVERNAETQLARCSILSYAIGPLQPVGARMRTNRGEIDKWEYIERLVQRCFPGSTSGSIVQRNVLYSGSRMVRW